MKDSLALVSLDWVTYAVGGLGVFGAVLVGVGILGILKSRSERRDQQVRLDRVTTTMANYTARSVAVHSAGGVHNVGEERKERIERLAKSLHESQLVIAELQAEMEAKVAAVKRLRAEEEQSRQLAALREKEAQAVRSLVSATIDSAHLKLQGQLERERDELRNQITQLQEVLASMRKTGRRDQIIFFGLGALVSIPIGIVINIVF